MLFKSLPEELWSKPTFKSNRVAGAGRKPLFWVGSLAPEVWSPEANSGSNQVRLAPASGGFDFRHKKFVILNNVAKTRRGVHPDPLFLRVVPAPKFLVGWSQEPEPDPPVSPMAMRLSSSRHVPAQPKPTWQTQMFTKFVTWKAHFLVQNRIK